jgi:hypothetical protein
MAEIVLKRAINARNCVNECEIFPADIAHLIGWHVQWQIVCDVGEFVQSMIDNVISSAPAQDWEITFDDDEKIASEIFTVEIMNIFGNRENQEVSLSEFTFAVIFGKIPRVDIDCVFESIDCFNLSLEEKVLEWCIGKITMKSAIFLSPSENLVRRKILPKVIADKRMDLMYNITSACVLSEEFMRDYCCAEWITDKQYQRDIIETILGKQKMSANFIKTELYSKVNSLSVQWNHLFYNTKIGEECLIEFIDMVNAQDWGGILLFRDESFSATFIDEIDKRGFAAQNIDVVIAQHKVSEKFRAKHKKIIDGVSERRKAIATIELGNIDL